MLEDSELSELLRAGREEGPGELRRRRVRERVLSAVGAASAAGVATLGAQATASAASTTSAAGKGLGAWWAGSAGAKLTVTALGLCVAGASTGVLWSHGQPSSAPAAHQEAPRAEPREVAARALPPREPLDAARKHLTVLTAAEQPRGVPPPSALPAPLTPAQASDTASRGLPSRAAHPSHAGLEARAPHPAKPTRSEPRPSTAELSTLPLLGPEAQLLSRALRALSGGEPAQALELLAQHARVYPLGALAPERSAARIRALCALGRAEEAEVEARAFARRFPGSPLGHALSRCAP